MYEEDKRIVLTLDAGGTNLVFSAMRSCRQTGKSFRLPTRAESLDRCLEQIVSGFDALMDGLPEPPAAISFAFPGPADYANGIIGDLPNFPSFRGGVALGPFLEEKFHLPVFINNDGDLFTYGEALSGILPETNARLEATGSGKRFHNLLGVTLGTGFGAGVVTEDCHLLRGDNSCGGDVWCTPGKFRPELIAEEDVSIRAVKRVYNELTQDTRDLAPKDIFDIAEGSVQGDRQAALTAFARLGEAMGHTIAQAITLLDGLVVIGGGLSGASKYFMPALLDELRGTAGTLSGESFPRLQMSVFDLDDEFEAFAKGSPRMIDIPLSHRKVPYDPVKRIGIGISRLGTSNAVSIGAYTFALNSLDIK